MIKVALGLLLVAIFYQITAAPLYAFDVPGVGRVAPDLVLVAVAALSVRWRSTRGAMAAALLVGLLVDLLSVDPFLTRTASYALAALVGTRCGRHGLEASALARCFHLMVATGLGTLAGMGWLHATAYPHLAPSWRCWAAEWAYHTGLGIVVLGLLEPFTAQAQTRVKSWYASV